MSAVRMCDGCGNIFKEGIEGSAVGGMTVMVKGEDGRKRPEQVIMDQCPTCVEGSTKRAVANSGALAIEGVTE